MEGAVPALWCGSQQRKHSEPLLQLHALLPSSKKSHRVAAKVMLCHESIMLCCRCYPPSLPPLDFTLDMGKKRKRRGCSHCLVLLFPCQGNGLWQEETTSSQIKWQVTISLNTNLRDFSSINKAVAFSEEEIEIKGVWGTLSTGVLWNLRG